MLGTCHVYVFFQSKRSEKVTRCDMSEASHANMYVIKL